jgi:hypothetical protein
MRSGSWKGPPRTASRVPTALFLIGATFVMAGRGMAAAQASSGLPSSPSPTPQPTPFATTSVSWPATVVVETPKPAPTPRPTPAPQQTTIPPDVHAKRSLRTALIVGVNDTDPNRPLQGAVADATYMRDALVAHGFKPGDIYVLLDGAATRRRILDELGALAARTDPDGFAVVAVATHASGTSFRAGDDRRVSVGEFAAGVGAIRARVWTVMAVCYAARFGIAGVTGAGRIATFSSDADHLTYEMGSGGSEFVYDMVQHGMVQRAADRSIEAAFGYAWGLMTEDGTSPGPVIVDGIPGEVALGP